MIDTVSMIEAEDTEKALQALLTEFEVEVRVMRHFNLDGRVDGYEAQAWSEEIVRPRHMGSGFGDTFAETLQDLIEYLEGDDGDA
jgi:hypothetical protein